MYSIEALSRFDIGILDLEFSFLFFVLVFCLQYQRWFSYCMLNITTDIAAGNSMNVLCLFLAKESPISIGSDTRRLTLASCDQWIIGLRNVCRGMYIVCVKHHQLERPCVAHSLTHMGEAPVLVSSATLSFYEAFFEKTLKIFLFTNFDF